MSNAFRLARRAGRANPYLLVALVALPLAGLGIHRWLHASRAVEAAEMVGVWQIAVPEIVAPTGLQAQVAGLTNQWIALGSRGTCWFHAPSPSSPWRGQATWTESITYGHTLSPVQWPGGPPTAAASAATEETGRRRPREIKPPTLTWTYHTRPAGSRSVALAQIVISRDGRLDGNITVEAHRGADGQVRLAFSTQPPEGKVDYTLVRSDALDIDATAAAAPPAPATPAPPAG